MRDAAHSFPHPHPRVLQPGPLTLSSSHFARPRMPRRSPLKRKFRPQRLDNCGLLKSAARRSAQELAALEIKVQALEDKIMTRGSLDAMRRLLEFKLDSLRTMCRERGIDFSERPNRQSFDIETSAGLDSGDARRARASELTEASATYVFMTLPTKSPDAETLG